MGQKKLHFGDQCNLYDSQRHNFALKELFGYTQYFYIVGSDM